MKKMKAIVCTKYGPPEVMILKEIDKPVPKNNEVLIKIHATTAHVGDTKLRALKPGLGPVKDFFFKPVMRILIGFRKPRIILGMDIAGEIDAIGKDVTKFKIGDQVFASTYEGFKFGGYAEYKCMSENGIVAIKPSNMTYEQAAPIPNGGLTALGTLQIANIKQGQKVLIYGASGSLGTFAIPLAKHFGAVVTGVCSTSNLDLVKSLGADSVIDYTKEDFSKAGETYDIIYDTVGKVEPAKRKKSLKKTGIYLSAINTTIKLKVGNLIFLKELAEKGKLKSVIDRTYPLEQIVEAHRYVDSRRKKGNVVITV